MKRARSLAISPLLRQTTRPLDYSEAFCGYAPRGEAELQRLLVEDALKDKVTRLKDQASQRDKRGW